MSASVAQINSNSKSSEFKNITEKSSILFQPIKVIVPRSFSTKEIVNYIIQTYKEDTSFTLLNIETLKVQYDKWRQNLPTVFPYYAVKSNPDIRILKALADLGTNFDCASENEIKSVLSVMNDPERIIFAHPFKAPKQLLYAASVGVNKMTADSVEELEKCLLLHKNAKVLIRLDVDNSFSVVNLSNKFGAFFEVAEKMLKFAKEHNQEIVGVSFHVGSACQSAEAYSLAMKISLKVLNLGISMGLPMTMLNIGGGFPGLHSFFKHPPFEELAFVINKTLQKDFSHIKNLEVISEPGRYFSNATVSLVIPIIGKKKMIEGGKEFIWYYLDQGLYGCFHGLFHHKNAIRNVVPLNFDLNNILHPSILWGPTCDASDRIGEYLMPEMVVGDFVWVESYGAYAFTSNQMFNGFDDAKKYQIIYDETE